MLGLVLAIFVQSISTLLPSKLMPHDHLLVGNVTAEQLRAHLAAEAQEMQNLDQTAPVPSSSSNQVSVTTTGGRIISEFAGFGLILILQLEMALQVVSLLSKPVHVYPIRSVRLRLQAPVLSPPNPPPRPVRISF